MMRINSGIHPDPDENSIEFALVIGMRHINGVGTWLVLYEQ